jgi:hypothetical protein
MAAGRGWDSLNKDTPHLSELTSRPYKELVVFCSSNRCAPGSGLKHGAFIEAGHHVRQFQKCPACGSTQLKFHRMSEGWILDKVEAKKRKLKRSA